MLRTHAKPAAHCFIAVWLAHSSASLTTACARRKSSCLASVASALKWCVRNQFKPCLNYPIALSQAPLSACTTTSPSSLPQVRCSACSVTSQACMQCDGLLASTYTCAPTLACACSPAARCTCCYCCFACVHEPPLPRNKCFCGVRPYPCAGLLLARKASQSVRTFGVGSSLPSSSSSP